MQAKLRSMLESDSPGDILRMEVMDLYDPFEPNLVRAGLDAAPYLGPTIFGDAWFMLEGRPAVSLATTVSPSTNPLDQMYSRVQKTGNGMLLIFDPFMSNANQVLVVNVHMHRFLNTDCYVQLYTELTSTTCKYVRTQAFKFSKRPVWTVLPPLSSLMRIISPTAASASDSVRNIKTYVIYSILQLNSILTHEQALGIYSNLHTGSNGSGLF